MLNALLASMLFLIASPVGAQSPDRVTGFESADVSAPQGVGDHRVLWRFRLDGYSLGRRVDVGPDGTLYTSNIERLYAFIPGGELLWTVEGAGGGRPVTFGADGTIYTGGSLVTAINPDGTVKWRFDNPRPGLDLAAGPNIGPDGNIYAAMDVDGDSDSLGVFSLDPDGNLRWSTGLEYPIISLRGPSYTDILFDTDRMYITVYRRLSRPPTIRTYSFDGDLMWYTGDMPLAVGGPPQLHPDGNLIMNWAQTGVQSLSKDGELQWIEDHPIDGQLLLTPNIAADGTVYVADWSGPDWWAIDGEGSTLWLGPQPGYDSMSDFAITPDQNQLVASGSDSFGVPGWVRGYDANGTGDFLWQIDLHIESGLNEHAGSMGTFSSDSRTAYFATNFPGHADYGYIYAIDISLDLDCDGDGLLDIDDNCVCEFNPDQFDFDGDGIGDVCDPFILPDNCVDALPLCPGTTFGNSIGATNDGLSTCSPRDINRDVWYAYSPITSGTVSIDGAGSQYSFYLSAHTDCPGTMQNQIACGFDNSDGIWPRLDLDVVAGETYYIRVNGFNAVEMESFQLAVTGPGCEPAPPIADTIPAQTPQNTDVLITLSAFDDGLPAGTLLYLVHSLPFNGALVDTSTGSGITDVPYLLNGDTVTYNPDTYYQGTDSFIFSANDGGDWPNGGVSNLASVEVEVAGPEPIHKFLFDDTDPGFEMTGDWAFGQPTGQGTQSFDPTSGYTGNNVLGYNLNGDYTDDMPERYLTTTPMDFTGVQDVRVSFQKWLGIETALFDHAAIWVRSEDSNNWTVVWEHNVLENLRTTEWEQVEYDISAVADGKSSVQLRWVMGTTDSLITYPGWNIDDIEFIGLIPVVGCPPDLNDDGELNFFDVSSFLNSFTAAAPPADLDHNGDWNFFDVSAFLNAFSAGCP